MKSIEDSLQSLSASRKNQIFCLETIIDDIDFPVKILVEDVPKHIAEEMKYVKIEDFVAKDALGDYFKVIEGTVGKITKIIFIKSIPS